MDSKHGYIKDTNNFDPDNPQIVVVGLCSCTLQYARERAIYYLELAIKNIKNKSAASVNNILFDKYSTGYCYIKAVEDVERELQTPAIKRKITLMKQRKK